MGMKGLRAGGRKGLRVGGRIVGETAAFVVVVVVVVVLVVNVNGSKPSVVDVVLEGAVAASAVDTITHPTAAIPAKPKISPRFENFDTFMSRSPPSRNSILVFFVIWSSPKLLRLQSRQIP